MDVTLGFVLFAFDAITDFKTSGLVVGTVRAGNKLSISVIPREPSLQVVLLTSSIIQLTRANRNNSIRKP
jgi:hypothetical protein